MSRRRLSPEDVISAIYEEEGFYEVERRGDSESEYMTRLVLSNGDRELVISILDEDAFSTKGAIQDALLQAEKLKARFDGVIIAVPRKYQRAVDEDVMALHGFGLVIYDKLGAEEILPPRMREPGKKPVEKQELKEERRIDDQEIVKLRMEISKLLRSLEEIEARLDRLEREQNKIITRLSKLESQVSQLGKAEAVKVEKQRREVELVKQAPTDKSLPSYLRDNPWIEILSRRE